MLKVVQSTLLNPICSAANAEARIPTSPGYYSIFVEPQALDELYSDHIGVNGLIYVGIASKSLVKRLVQQELTHNSPATFFRSLGAILGYRPPEGSLRGKRNQRNYRFSASDTAEIVGWINQHASVSWFAADSVDSAIEEAMIRTHTPMINIKHNPRPCPGLKQVRAQCRKIAVG